MHHPRHEQNTSSGNPFKGILSFGIEFANLLTKLYSGSNLNSDMFPHFSSMFLPRDENALIARIGKLFHKEINQIVSIQFPVITFVYKLGVLAK